MERGLTSFRRSTFALASIRIRRASAWPFLAASIDAVFPRNTHIDAVHPDSRSKEKQSERGREKEAKRAARHLREETEAEAHQRFLKSARELPPVRLEKVLNLRRQIAEGTYVTEDKVQATIDRILESLQG